jgi:hypothetical protein
MDGAKLSLGEVAFLRVTDVTQFGAFVDWGLPKELLIPFAEQTCDLNVGDVHPFGLMLDNIGRHVGTMRVREMLKTVGEFEPNEWVHGEAWRQEPGLGLFVIIERRFLGLLPAQEPHQLSRGEAVELRVAQILGDGKLEVSLRGLVHEELEHDATDVLEKLTTTPTLRVTDQSSPEEIRAVFGLSKKAFKRAIGRLLKDNKITRDVQGCFVPRA